MVWLEIKNLYSYCDNNPIIREDKSGKLWFVIGAAINVGLKMIANKIEKKSLTDGLILAGISGAASGALGCTSIKLLGQVIGNGLISGGINLVHQGIKKGFSNISRKEVILETISGCIGGLIGGPGSGTRNIEGHFKNISKFISNNKNVKSI